MEKNIMASTTSLSLLKKILNKLQSLFASSKIEAMPDDALIKAVQGGEIAEVKRLLEEGKVNINDLNQDGYTPLMWAAKFEKLDIVNLLLRKGAEVNIKNSSGETALMMVKNPKVIEALVAKGADVNAKDHEGQTEFMKCAMALDMPKMKLLLTSGANINEIDDKGRTPLMLLLEHNLQADEKKTLKAIDFLLDNGANPNVIATDGHTAISVAAQSENHSFITELLKKGFGVDLEHLKAKKLLSENAMSALVNAYINHEKDSPAK